jgi:hypothetical protein
MQASAYPEAVRLPEPAQGGHLAVVLASGISFCAIAGLFAAGQGPLLRVAIPAVASLLALVLYFQRPIVYVQFTLWIWFLTPWLRRLVDWRFGFAEPNFILLTPFLVAAIAGITLFRRDPQFPMRIPPTFVFCGTAIFYGFVVGMVLHPSGETIYGFVNWLSPLLFGLHLCMRWQDYEKHRDAIRRTFVLGILVMGIYGIYQYAVAPALDVYWLFNVQSPNSLAPSFGLPEPFLLRIWSTLNAPGPFADVMMVGLLLLLGTKSKLKIPAALVGYFTLLLSAVRTAWLGWVVGIVLTLRRSKPILLIRLALSGALLAVCLVFFMKVQPLQSQVTDRLQTMSSLESDSSFSDRAAMYEALTTEALTAPFGSGVSNSNEWHNFMIDSGFLVIFLSFGWFGTVAFLTGVVLFLWHTRKNSSSENLDEFQIACRAICIALLMQMVGGNVFTGVLGAMFWIFAGMIFASQTHGEQEPALVETATPENLTLRPVNQVG